MTRCGGDTADIDLGQTYNLSEDLANIFDRFLPFLLRNPNPTDPLNNEAANLYLAQPEEYVKKVKEYVQKYATKEALRKMEKRPIELEIPCETDMDKYRRMMKAAEYVPPRYQTLEEFEENYGKEYL